MTIARVLVAMVLVLALQTTLLRFVGGLGATIDLVLVAVIYLGLSGGPVAGLVAGTLGGVAQDALSSGILGIGGLAKTAIGFAAGVVGTQFIVGQALPRAVVFFGGGLADALVFSGMHALVGLRSFDLALSTTAARAAANAVLGVVLFELAEFLPGALERRRARRGGMRVRPRFHD